MGIGIGIRIGIGIKTSIKKGTEGSTPQQLSPGLNIPAPPATWENRFSPLPGASAPSPSPQKSRLAPQVPAPGTACTQATPLSIA